MIHHLEYPFSLEQIQKLKLGDTVYVSGKIIISAGIPAYKRLVEYVKSVQELPVDIAGGALFHLGANTQKIDGQDKVLYINPTTSARFNPYMPTLIRELDLRLVGGKGGLDSGSVEAMQETGCVYLAFLGGGAPIYSRAVTSAVADIYWTDLVPHYRLTQLRAHQLGPLIVAIDAHGNSLYEQVEVNLEYKYPEILEKLNR